MKKKATAKPSRRPMGPVAARVRQLLAEHDVGVGELSRRTGISLAAMGRWWRGEAEPRVDTRQLIARALGIDLSELLLDDEGRLAKPPELVAAEAVIDGYLASPEGADLTPTEAAELRICAGWLPGKTPLTAREVRGLADVIRMRLRQPADLRVKNPHGHRRRTTTR